MLLHFIIFKNGGRYKTRTYDIYLVKGSALPTELIDRLLHIKLGDPRDSNPCGMDENHES